MDKPSMKAFLRDQQGSVITVLAASMMVVVGFTGLAVDGGYLYSLRSKLQATADAAVLAAVGNLPDTNAVRVTAVDYATKNMPIAEHGAVLTNADVVTGNWNAGTRIFTPAGAPINAVRVVTRRSQANGNAAGVFFARVLGFDQVDIVTSAVATKGQSVCMMALDPSNSGAIKFEGDETIVAPDCSIQVNSTDPVAVEITPSSPNVTAKSFGVTGGIVGPTGGFSPAPETGISPVADPFASVAQPSAKKCDFTHTIINGGNTNLSPAVYCAGLKVMNNATVTLDPGLYIMKNGPFSLDGTSSVTGSDLTVYLTGNPTAIVNFVKDSQVNLSAPTTGPLAGLVFFEDGILPTPRTHFVGSNANHVFEGTLYFPEGKVKVVSRIGAGPSPALCTAIIAKKFRFSSNAALYLNGDCHGFGGVTALVQ